MSDFQTFFLIISIRHLLSDKQKKRFENPTFIGLTQVSRVNMIWGNHLNISNGVTVLVNISHMCQNNGSKLSLTELDTKSHKGFSWYLPLLILYTIKKKMCSSKSWYERQHCNQHNSCLWKSIFPFPDRSLFVEIHQKLPKLFPSWYHNFAHKLQLKLKLELSWFVVDFYIFSAGLMLTKFSTIL